MSRPGDPLTRARSPWTDVGPFVQGAVEGRHYRRNVHDGWLSAIVTHEPHGLHLSVAYQRPAGAKHRALRYPSWDEIADARYELCPPDIDMVIILPAAGDYVAWHPTTFHLHQIDNLPATATDRPR